MNFDVCINKINKYLSATDAQPLIVNVQNGNDLEKVITHFDVDGNIIIDAASFCNKDELPRIETLLASISLEKKKCFLVGLTSFLRFYGEDELRKHLANIINMTIKGHVVLLSYQCQKLLDI